MKNTQQNKIKVKFKAIPDVAVCCCQITCLNNHQYCCNLKIITLDDKGKCKAFIKTKIIKVKKSLNEKESGQKRIRSSVIA